jgi:PIN domain nuclease of toxin-antitoxin system
LTLLDTHVAIWLFEARGRIGKGARRLLDRAAAAGEVAVSAISFWELAQLVERDRIDLDLSPSEWRRRALSAGLIELPLTGEIGIAAAQLDGFHGDPGDRMLTATAIVHDAVMVTSDEQILRWKGPLQRRDAST